LGNLGEGKKFHIAEEGGTTIQKKEPSPASKSDQFEWGGTEDGRGENRRETVKSHELGRMLIKRGEKVKTTVLRRVS